MKSWRKNKIITKNIINRNISIDCSNRYSNRESSQAIYNFDDLSKSIAQAKLFLINNRAFKKGDRVVLATSIWPEFVIWFFAAAELGGVFLVLDSPTRVSFGIFKYRLDIYDKIDHFIHPDLDEYRSLIKKLGIEKKSIIDSVYRLQSYCDKIENLVCVKNSDTLLCSLSSGTTGKPKLIFHNHDFFYRLMLRNVKIFGYKESDRCSHIRNLHHGSVLGVYFLPTINACSFHIFDKFLPETVGKYTESIYQNKVNRMIMYSSFDLQLITQELKKYKPREKLFINVLFEPREEYLNFLCGERNYDIISIFGCTETSGPLFLQRIGSTNYKNINFQNFGKPLDNFYGINLKDHILNVTLFDGSIVSTGDKFEVHNGEWYHLGREFTNKFRGTPLYIPLIIGTVEEFARDVYRNFKHLENFDLTIDYDFDKIYVRSDHELDLSKLNDTLEKIYETNSFNIDYVMIDDRKNYTNGIKFDAEYFRSICRKKLGLIVDKN